MLVCLPVSLLGNTAHKYSQTTHTHVHTHAAGKNGCVCGFRSDDERWELACVRHLMRGGFNKDNSGGCRLRSFLDVVPNTHTYTHTYTNHKEFI